MCWSFFLAGTSDIFCMNLTRYSYGTSAQQLYLLIVFQLHTRCGMLPSAKSEPSISDLQQQG